MTEIERIAKKVLQIIRQEGKDNKVITGIPIARYVLRRELEARIDELNRVPPLHKAEGFNFLRIRQLQFELENLK